MKKDNKFISGFIKPIRNFIDSEAESHKLSQEKTIELLLICLYAERFAKYETAGREKADIEGLAIGDYIIEPEKIYRDRIKKPEKLLKFLIEYHKEILASRRDFKFTEKRADKELWRIIKDGEILKTEGYVWDNEEKIWTKDGKFYNWERQEVVKREIGNETFITALGKGRWIIKNTIPDTIPEVT